MCPTSVTHLWIGKMQCNYSVDISNFDLSVRCTLRKPPSAREGDHEVVEGACVTKCLYLLHCDAFSLSRLRRQLPPRGSLSRSSPYTVKLQFIILRDLRGRFLLQVFFEKSRARQPRSRRDRFQGDPRSGIPLSTDRGFR